MNGNGKPLVSVIMNCHNDVEYLKKAIDSVYEQSYKNWEIIFWDNASSVDVKGMIKLYDSRIKYYRSDIKLKLYLARNLALKKCSGQYVTFLDCDDLWASEKLTKQVECAMRTNASLVYTSYNWIDHSDKKILTINVPEKTGNLAINNIKKYRIGILTVLIRLKDINNKNISFNPNLDYCGDALFFYKIMSCLTASSMSFVSSSLRRHNASLSRKLSKVQVSRELRYMMAQLLKMRFFRENEKDILRAKSRLMWEVWGIYLIRRRKYYLMKKVLLSKIIISKSWLFGLIIYILRYKLLRRIFLNFVLSSWKSLT